MKTYTPAKYRTTNWSSYNAALKTRGSLMLWIDKEMSWHGEATGKRGRIMTFSDRAIQFCLTIKGLFGLPLRQTTGFVESLIRLAGLTWAVPDYSTLCRRQKT
ncbi:MAG: transposase, partial [Agitococcus sp.]